MPLRPTAATISCAPGARQQLSRRILSSGTFVLRDLSAGMGIRARHNLRSLHDQQRYADTCYVARQRRACAPERNAEPVELGQDHETANKGQSDQEQVS